MAGEGNRNMYGRNFVHNVSTLAVTNVDAPYLASLRVEIDKIIDDGEGALDESSPVSKRAVLGGIKIKIASLIDETIGMIGGKRRRQRHTHRRHRKVSHRRQRK